MKTSSDMRTNNPEAWYVRQPLHPGSRTHLPSSEPSIPTPMRVEMNESEELGNFIKLDTSFYIDKLFHAWKGYSKFSKHLAHLRHKAAPLLSWFAKRGVPSLLHTICEPWSINMLSFIEATILQLAPSLNSSTKILVACAIKACS